MKKIYLVILFLTSCASIDYDKTPIKVIHKKDANETIYLSTRIGNSAHGLFQKSLYVTPYISEKEKVKSWEIKIVTLDDRLYFNRLTYQCDKQKEISFSSNIKNWNKSYEDDCTTGECITVEQAHIKVTKEFMKGILACEDLLNFTVSGKVRKTSRLFKLKFNKKFYKGIQDLKKVMN